MEPGALKDALKQPLVLDGRNIYEPHAMAAAGLTYLGIGRNNRALLAPQTRVQPVETIVNFAADEQDAPLEALAELASHATAEMKLPLR